MGLSTKAVEVNFDGLVGPTHNFAGLSAGNFASLESEGKPSFPRAAALEGLAKMRTLHELGVRQAVLPPQPRPHLATLHRLGFRGAPEEVLAEVASREPRLLRLVSSASSMWAANAATVAPSCDTLDGRVHLVPANLCAMFHRSIEAATTQPVLAAIFGDSTRFVVHEPLHPVTQLADEGAANHTRLCTSAGRKHLFAWGRRGFDGHPGLVATAPARQTLEASQAVARLLALPESSAIFAQQHPRGIDAGAFHTDVVAVGNERVLLAHELAFQDTPAVLAALQRELGGELTTILVPDAELPIADAVAAYPFNSQIVTLGRDPLDMVLIAPVESRENPRARATLERVVADDNPITRVMYLDVRQSMKNGGGPACLRQRIPLTADEIGALTARVMIDDALLAELEAWVIRHYRDRLAPADLADPALHRESMNALAELAGILRLGSVLDE